MCNACTPILVGVASPVSEILLLPNLAKFPFWKYKIFNTVQEYLLARVIFGKFVCKKQLADFILAI